MRKLLMIAGSLVLGAVIIIGLFIFFLWPSSYEGDTYEGEGDTETVKLLGMSSMTMADRFFGYFGAAAQEPIPIPAATSAPGAIPMPMPTPALLMIDSLEAVKKQVSGKRGPAGQDAPSGALKTSQRKIISAASISVQVEAAQDAANAMQTIAEGLGGFVEHLNISGDVEEKRATMIIRVPQAQFLIALERIEALGKVLRKNLGSEDVSETFIDLEARLNSALREEESFLSLLDKSSTVTDVLAIERELARVRLEIERFQGQLNYLTRRVDLATITVSLEPPSLSAPEPPSASLAMEVSNVKADVKDLKALLSSLNGTLDSVVLSERDNIERAYLEARVFSADFETIMDFLEDLGKVKRKEMREGVPGEKASPGVEEKPAAAVAVSLFEKQRSVNVPLVIGVILGAAGFMLLVLLLYGVYRLGVHRRS